MIYELRESEPLALALKKFRRLVQRAGIIREHSAHRYYVKPSARRRRKRRLAAVRRAKQARRAARGAG